MYRTITELLSILLFLSYYYITTKDKIIAWILSYIMYFTVCAILFRKLFPNTPFVSPTPEYIVFLIAVGVPFLVLVVLLGVKFEKSKNDGTTKEKENFAILFKPTKSNIIFWTIIVLINLAAFLVGNDK
jgi:hypothetical protein